MLFGPVQGGWHHLGLPCGDMCPWLHMVRSNVPKALGTPCSPFSKGSLPPASFVISSFQSLILFAFGSMDALFQQELEASPFSKGGGSPISTSCYTLAAMGQLCRCLAKKKAAGNGHMHAYMFFLQPKAAYLMITHVFVEMLKQNYSRWKTHTDTHLLKTTIKRTTLQRKKHYHPPSSAHFCCIRDPGRVSSYKSCSRSFEQGQATSFQQG